MLDPRLHEQVNIAKLLFAGGLVRTVAEGTAAIVHGRVRIEQWTLSIAEATLPRWTLRAVTIHVADRSLRVSGDGFRLKRVEAPEPML